jgi:hypothetical protein
VVFGKETLNNTSKIIIGWCLVRKLSTTLLRIMNIYWLLNSVQFLQFLLLPVLNDVIIFKIFILAKIRSHSQPISWIEILNISFKTFAQYYSIKLSIYVCVILRLMISLITISLHNMQWTFISRLIYYKRSPKLRSCLGESRAMGENTIPK